MFKIKSQKRRTKLFKYWIASYITVFVSSIVLSIAIFTYMNIMVTDTINNSTNYLIKYIEEIMDSYIETSIKQINQIYINEEVQSLQNIYSNKDNEIIMDYYNLYREIKTFHLSQRYFYECFIYFPDKDKVVSSISGAMSAGLFYELRFEDTGASYSDYINILSNRYRYEINEIYISEGDADYVKKIVFSQSMPEANARTLLSNIFIVFDNDILMDITKNNVELENGLIAIKSESDIVYSTDDGLFQDIGILKNNSYLEKDYFIEKIDGQKYIISEVPAYVKGYSYLIVIPESVFYKEYYNMTYFVIVFMTLLMVVGIVLSIFFASHQYKPIANIISTIDGRESHNTKSYEEYSYIKNTFINKIKQIQQMEDKINNYKPLIRITYLKRLLRGEIEISDDYLSDMLSSGISFIYDKFYVFCIYIEDFSKDHIPSKYEYGYAKATTITELILHDIFDDINTASVNMYSVTIDDIIVYIVNHNLSSEKIKPYTLSLIEESQNIIYEKYAIDFSTGVSSFDHIGIDSINSAWQEANYSLDYRCILGKRFILFYDEIGNLRRLYEFSLETQERLINFINAGDVKNATALARQIMHSNFSSERNEHLALETIRCLTNDIIGTIVSAFSNKNFQKFIEDTKPNLKIYQAIQKKEYIIDVVESIVGDACNYMIDFNDEYQQNSLSLQIEKYINENYANPNLNITLLGEIFNLTPTYLSKIFNSQTGTQLLSFINNVRIDNAKIMLTSANTNINDVAERCGYTNSHSFIRVFKKIEGITPGNYRKINRYRN